MGILHGSLLLDHFYNGLYSRTNNHRMNLYVDGEFIRFKGMTEGNMIQRDSEEAVAVVAASYLKSRVDRLSDYFQKQFDTVYVYMDGDRVKNKIQRTYDNDMDVGRIRCVFSKRCAYLGYEIIQLNQGEAELQMYLKRDRSTNLNVFFTKDTDMLSILYGHRAQYYDDSAVALPYGADIVKKFQPNNDGLPIILQNSRTHSEDVCDLNDTYAGGVNAYDSCAWAVCDCPNRPLTVIGFDATVERMGYSKLVFCTFCSMVGTDFTNSVITRGMITGFFTSADPEELQRVNAYSLSLHDDGNDDHRDPDCYEKYDRQLNSLICSYGGVVPVNEMDTVRVMEIVILILLSGLRSGGTIKRAKKNTRACDTWPLVVDVDPETCLKEFNALCREFFTIVFTYYTYIKTGIMIPGIPRIENPQLYVKTIVHVCRDGVNAHHMNPMVTSCVREWSRKTDLNTCASNMRTTLRDKVGLVKTVPKKMNCRRQLFTNTDDDAGSVVGITRNSGGRSNEEALGNVTENDNDVMISSV